MTPDREDVSSFGFAIGSCRSCPISIVYSSSLASAEKLDPACRGLSLGDLTSRYTQRKKASVPFFFPNGHRVRRLQVSNLPFFCSASNCVSRLSLFYSTFSFSPPEAAVTFSSLPSRVFIRLLLSPLFLAFVKVAPGRG